MALRTLAFQELSRGRPVSTHKMTPESIIMTEEQISEKGIAEQLLLTAFCVRSVGSPTLPQSCWASSIVSTLAMHQYL